MHEHGAQNKEAQDTTRWMLEVSDAVQVEGAVAVPQLEVVAAADDMPAADTAADTQAAVEIPPNKKVISILHISRSMSTTASGACDQCHMRYTCTGLKCTTEPLSACASRHLLHDILNTADKHTWRYQMALQAKKNVGIELEKQQAVVSGIMSRVGFDTLEVSDQTRKAIAEMGFTQMTEVQARTIPQLLTGRDVLGAAKTGQHQHH